MDLLLGLTLCVAVLFAPARATLGFSRSSRNLRGGRAFSEVAAVPPPCPCLSTPAPLVSPVDSEADILALETRELADAGLAKLNDEEDADVAAWTQGAKSQARVIVEQSANPFTGIQAEEDKAMANWVQGRSATEEEVAQSLTKGAQEEQAAVQNAVGGTSVQWSHHDAQRQLSQALWPALMSSVQGETSALSARQDATGLAQAASTASSQLVDVAVKAEQLAEHVQPEHLDQARRLLNDIQGEEQALMEEGRRAKLLSDKAATVVLQAQRDAIHLEAASKAAKANADGAMANAASNAMNLAVLRDRAMQALQDSEEHLGN